MESAINTQNQSDKMPDTYNQDEQQERYEEPPDERAHFRQGNGHDVPSTNQYEFFIPEGAAPEDIQGIYDHINLLETDEQCVAYWNALAELRQWMVPEDIEEVKQSIHGRRKQLRGDNHAR